MGAAYPNLANGGEKIRLIHLANLTSQLVDNIPDLTQVRTVPGEPMAATRMPNSPSGAFPARCISTSTR